MVICLELGADLHMAQLMPLPLTVSCFSKIQIGFTCLVPAHPGSPGERAIKHVCVCACVRAFVRACVGVHAWQIVVVGCVEMRSFAVDSESPANSVGNSPASASAGETLSSSPSRSRSLANTPAVRFLTRPDLFALIQTNEVRSTLLCLCLSK